MNRDTQIGFSLLFLSILLASAPGVRAQEPLTLGKAVELALHQNPSLQSAKDDADAARARVKEIRAGWLPRFDFSQGFTRGNNPVYVFGTLLTQRSFTAANFTLSNLNTPAPLDNFQTRLDGQISLFDSFRTRFRMEGAKEQLSMADSQTEQSRQDLILQVVHDYYGVIVARENLLAADDALRTAESNERRTEHMQTAGLIVDSDVLSAKVFLAQMKDRKIRTQNDLESAQTVLAREMGMTIDAHPEPSEALSEPNSIPTNAQQEWIQTALEHRPILQMAQLREEAARSEGREARAELGPTVGLYANLERDALTLGGPSGTNWTAGARIDFNLYSGGAQTARRAESQASQSKAKHDLEWVRSGVLVEVRHSYLEASAAAQRAATARDAVEQARESLRIIQNRYEAGLTNVTETLRAQTAHLEAHTGYLAALHDWQVARAKLEHSAGVLTPDSALLQGRAQ